MDCQKLHCRVYIPSCENGIDTLNTDEYLQRYLDTEFPKPDKNGFNKIYSIPKDFTKSGERQATLAEKTVFDRLKGIENSPEIKNLWLMFFHNASYAGRSFRNQRYGKLMVREHDFVIFARYNGKCFIALTEVKSTNDAKTNKQDIVVISDAKVIKNNKRSAQHQLRDHIEIIEGLLGRNSSDIQNYIMWPFLGALTKDPKQMVIRRWKEDANLHVFEDILSNQPMFNHWFLDNILSGKDINEKHFDILLKRFIILSCGVFIDEINDGLLALMTQQQLELLNSDHCEKTGGKPLVVHGAAGTGKTLLIVRKLQQLYEAGELDENNRALYICYWPGIRFDVQCKLKSLGISDYVDTTRFFISQGTFLQSNKKSYKHIFMDEAEAICLAFESNIADHTISMILQKYHDGNCDIATCSNYETCKSRHNYTNEFISCNNLTEKWGDLWLMVDINQASIFLPKHSPNILKTPNISLTKVMRSTGNIFKVLKQYYSNPIPLMPRHMLEKMSIPNITMGHHILGPPVFWVNPKYGVQNALIHVIIDLCATKGFKPNDLCVIPFLVNDLFVPNTINEEIGQHFVENGYRPRGVGDVEKFIESREVNDFLISWALRVKGLEFKVVIIVFDEEDFEYTDFEDRKKIYIIASRCTCMLIMISPKTIRDTVNIDNVINDYAFGLEL